MNRSPGPHPPPRFFLSPEQLSKDKISFPPELVHQLRRVLRLQRGDAIIVVDNSGWEYEVEIVHLGGGQGEGRVRQKGLATAEPKLRLNLYPALLRGERFEWLLQKGTELGIAAFSPLVCRRSVVQEVSPVKVERWQRIIREAAEQSGRGRLPLLSPLLPFERAWSEVEGPCLVPWEGETALGLKRALEGIRVNGFPLNLFIGPEGGFEEEEIALAQRYGGIIVSLGQRILRAETAAVTVSSILLFQWGELGS